MLVQIQDQDNRLGIFEILNRVRQSLIFHLDSKFVSTIFSQDSHCGKTLSQFLNLIRVILLEFTRFQTSENPFKN